MSNSVKIIRLTDEEKQLIKKQQENYENAVNRLSAFSEMKQFVEAEFKRLQELSVSADEKIKEFDNQTYLVTKSVINAYSKHFDGIEDMVEASNIVNAIKKENAKSIKLDKSQIKLMIDIFDGSVKNKLILSNMDRFIQVYQTFKEALN